MTPLPHGRAPSPAPLPHFSHVLAAVVWRNWDVIPVARLADVLGGTVEEIANLAAAMGLPLQREIDEAEVRRNYMTVLHRNWHLLPYEQICPLLGWDAVRLQFALNEDDFMYIKLGGYKPVCPPVRFQPLDPEHTRWISRMVDEEFGQALHWPAEPPFGFIQRFRADAKSSGSTADTEISLRMVYPYFLRFGDPLIGEGIQDIPDSYLAELAACGVNAVWLQGILNTLAPWELAPHLSAGWEERLRNLQLLVTRARCFGIEVLLYLNEPRAMPRAFYEIHPDLRGVEETPDRASYSPDVVALCVSRQPVRDFLVNSVRHVFERVPDLGGIFTITFSENLTHCFSREYDLQGPDEFALRSHPDEASGPAQACPHCTARGAETTHADVCKLLEKGMREAGSAGRFLLYAWSTPERWIPGIVEQLPSSTWLLCISEWGTPFQRGNYQGRVNEYSISVVGPSEQSVRQWKLARDRGLHTAAKMQAANTYEISSLPYIPALRLVAEHLSKVTAEGVEGLMLGWTAGGSPSPNLDLVVEFTKKNRPGVQEALRNVARRRFGNAAADEAVQAWNVLSDAYEQFPFDLTVCYNAPQSLGPANLLFAQPTGLTATMVTFPFDDLEGWRGPYSEEDFLHQFELLAEKWAKGVEILDALRAQQAIPALEDEWRIAEAARIHFRSTANQIRFIQNRSSDPTACALILRDEIRLARRLFDLVSADSRLGFEATNQYGYIRLDLAEKILNCRQLLEALKGRPDVEA